MISIKEQVMVWNNTKHFIAQSIPLPEDEEKYYTIHVNPNRVLVRGNIAFYTKADLEEARDLLTAVLNELDYQELEDATKERKVQEGSVGEYQDGDKSR